MHCTCACAAHDAHARAHERTHRTRRPLRTHARQVRAYAAALAVYSRKGWTHVEDHVHFTLGRNCATLGKVDLALQLGLGLGLGLRVRVRVRVS